MTMISVESSAIRAVGYDGYTLDVQFHTGKVYSLPGVPEYHYTGLMSASSMGAYFNRYLRGKYK